MTKTSWVWSYFTELENNIEAQCDICEEILSANNSTSNLNKHLRHVHKKEPASKRQKIEEK